MQTPPFYKASNYDPEQSVGFLMKRVLLSIVYQVDQRLQVHGLTSAQWGPLMRIQASGRCTVVELARWQNVDPGAMTRLLDRLEKKGLCRRVRSSTDRRVVNVELTTDGEASIAGVPAVLSDVLNAHLDGFSATEFQALKRSLGRMVASGDALRQPADAA